MTMAERYKNLVAGEWIAARGGESLRDLNPADTAEVVAEFPSVSAEDVTRAVDAAAEAFPVWKALTPVPRGAVLRRKEHGIEGLQFYARVKSVAMRVAGG